MLEIFDKFTKFEKYETAFDVLPIYILWNRTTYPSLNPTFVSVFPRQLLFSIEIDRTWHNSDVFYGQPILLSTFILLKHSKSNFLHSGSTQLSIVPASVRHHTGRPRFSSNFFYLYIASARKHMPSLRNNSRGLHSPKRLHTGENRWLPKPTKFAWGIFLFGPLTA